MRRFRTSNLATETSIFPILPNGSRASKGWPKELARIVTRYAASLCRAAPLMIAAPFSAIMMVGAFVLVEVDRWRYRGSMTSNGLEDPRPVFDHAFAPGGDLHDHFVVACVFEAPHPIAQFGSSTTGGDSAYQIGCRKPMLLGS